MPRRRSGRNPLVVSLIATGLLTTIGPKQADAQIVLSQDFDSGSLDVANSTVDGLVVTLEPRRYAGKDDDEWGFGVWNWVWVYFKASQVQGEVVTFRIPKDGAIFSSHSLYHRYVYSYDNQSWPCSTAIPRPTLTAGGPATSGVTRKTRR